jgi:steroid delta-isomerase-like uncharacterized protein
MPTANAAIIRRIFQDVWNKGNLKAVGEIVSPRYKMHDPMIEHEAGIEAFTRHVTLVRAIFPDIKFTIVDLFEADGKVAARWSARGTHKAEFLGVPATGKRVTVTGVTITRCSKGRILESWASWDALGMMQQLGVDVLQTAGSGLW